MATTTPTFTLTLTINQIDAARNALRLHVKTLEAMRNTPKASDDLRAALKVMINDTYDALTTLDETTL